MGGPRRLASGLLSRGDSGVSCPVAASPRSRKATAAAAAAAAGPRAPAAHLSEAGSRFEDEREDGGAGGGSARLQWRFLQGICERCP